MEIENSTAAIFVLFNKVWQAVVFYFLFYFIFSYCCWGPGRGGDRGRAVQLERKRETCTRERMYNFFFLGLEISMECIK